MNITFVFYFLPILLKKYLKFKFSREHKIAQNKRKTKKRLKLLERVIFLLMTMKIIIKFNNSLKKYIYIYEKIYVSLLF